MADRQSRITLVQVMTDPQSLYLLIRGQVPFMRARGIDTVGIATPGPLLQKFAVRDGAEVRGVPMSRVISPWWDAISVCRLWREIRRSKPQIVQSGTPKGGLLGMIAAWVARVPVRIYTIRGLPVETATGWQRRLLWSTEWLACRLSHRVVCVSHLLREYAIREGICQADKIVTFRRGSGNGVDATGRFNPATVGLSARAEVRTLYGIPVDAIVIGFVGRLIRIKGIVELAGAWEALRDEFPTVHLLAVGPFEEHDPVPEHVRTRLETDPRVHLTGASDDTPSLYRAMDILVLPTYREGVPNVLLEASAMALPIVSTLVPGPVEVVEDGVTGTLVPPADVDQLSDAIKRYISDAELRSRHGRAARDRVVAEFRQEDIWESWLNEYTSLLRAQGVLAGHDVVTRSDERAIHTASV
jgi:glycosyltransferase involved in cell wall biosynthesis